MNNEEDDQLQPPRPLPPTLTSDAGSSEVAVWLKWHRNVSRHPLLALYERHARPRADGKVGRLEQPDDVLIAEMYDLLVNGHETSVRAAANRVTRSVPAADGIPRHALLVKNSPEPEFPPRGRPPQENLLTSDENFRSSACARTRSARSLLVS